VILEGLEVSSSHAWRTWTHGAAGPAPVLAAALVISRLCPAPAARTRSGDSLSSPSAPTLRIWRFCWARDWGTHGRVGPRAVRLIGAVAVLALVAVAIIQRSAAMRRILEVLQSSRVFLVFLTHRPPNLATGYDPDGTTRTGHSCATVTANGFLDPIKFIRLGKQGSGF